MTDLQKPLWIIAGLLVLGCGDQQPAVDPAQSYAAALSILEREERALDAIERPSSALGYSIEWNAYSKERLGEYEGVYVSENTCSIAVSKAMEAEGKNPYGTDELEHDRRTTELVRERKAEVKLLREEFGEFYPTTEAAAKHEESIELYHERRNRQQQKVARARRLVREAESKLGT